MVAERVHARIRHSLFMYAATKLESFLWCQTIRAR